MVFVEHELLPKQLQFLESVAKHVLYSGCFRGGKSRGLCFKLVHRLSYPGAHELLCRKAGNTLAGSTLRTLLHGSGELPPVLPPGSYKHWKNDGIVELKHNGSIVQYFGLDDPQKRGSYEGTGAAIDEVVECDEQDLVWIEGRLSVEIPGLPRQMYTCCNPGPVSHPIAKRFGLAPGETIWPGHELIMTNMRENWFLPPDYVDHMDRTLKGVDHQRYFEGLWVAAAGAVYDNLNLRVHVRSDACDWPRYVLGVDDGHANPFAIVRGRVDSDGRVYFDREFYKPGLVGKSKRDAVRIMGGMEAEAVVVDPGAGGAQLITELENEGFPVIAADKRDVLAGISMVREMLRVREDGMPRMWFGQGLENSLREMSSYLWDKARDGQLKDKPLKKNDHIPDAVRYLVTYLAETAAPMFY